MSTNTMSEEELHKRIDAADCACSILRDKLREHYDSKPERWQKSATGEEWWCKIEAAQRALDALHETAG